MVVDGGAIAHLTLLISNNDTKLKRQVCTHIMYVWLYCSRVIVRGNWTRKLLSNSAVLYTRKISMQPSPCFFLSMKIFFSV